MPKLTYEHFRSRKDFEEFRDYLLKYIPGVIRVIQELTPTQQSLAEEIGVSKAAITYWLKGERKPTLENLTKLMAALEKRIGLINANLDVARNHLEMLRDVQERLERGDVPVRRRKGK